VRLILGLAGSSTAARNAADGNVGRQLQAEPLPGSGLVSRYRVPPLATPLTGPGLSRCSIPATGGLAAALLHRVCRS
jgi:hypothetical protein